MPPGYVIHREIVFRTIVFAFPFSRKPITYLASARCFSALKLYTSISIINIFFRIKYAAHVQYSLKYRIKIVDGISAEKTHVLSYELSNAK